MIDMVKSSVSSSRESIGTGNRSPLNRVDRLISLVDYSLPSMLKRAAEAAAYLVLAGFAMWIALWLFQ